MAYELRWGSDKPGHIVFLVDLSGSMYNKIDYTIDAIEKTCFTIMGRTMSGGKPKERVSISIYGYNNCIHNLFEPYTSAQELNDILYRLNEVRKNENKEAALFDKKGKAKPQNATYMQLAFETAKKDIENWISRQEKKFGPDKVPAPIVLNITDGYPWEGEKPTNDVFTDTLKAAKELMAIKTQDGNVRIFNIHHDPNIEGPTIKFPKDRPNSNVETQFLYDASSPMSEDMVATAQNQFHFPEASLESKCMISNEKNVSELIRFLEWGSSK